MIDIKSVSPPNLLQLILLLIFLSLSTAFPVSKPTATHENKFQFFLSDVKRSGYATELGYDQFLRKRLLERIEKRLLEREQRRKDNMEDGYQDMMVENSKQRSLLRRVVKFPFSVAKKLLRKPIEPGTLILIRHGESIWNANQTFTGWADPDLSERGYREAEHAAR
jgi:Histidine phosphatase superfamily (branch 1)